ncbi:uncharacterized protein LOC134787426 [Penaeus indicus]|uniref:uncharacterized protein LOC134787426 n=1 Tax=Penaeus indicus TaxID=29960 RepID=UPI00300D20AB
MAFINLEKDYDRVLREEMRKFERGAPEKHVKIIKESDRNATTKVRSTGGTTDRFKVKAGLQQGSARRPFLFKRVFNVLTETVRENPRWCVLYVDDVGLVATSKRALQTKLERWRQALENRGMKISRSKTEDRTTDGEGDQQDTIQLDRLNIKRVKRIKYLGATRKNG